MSFCVCFVAAVSLVAFRRSMSDGEGTVRTLARFFPLLAVTAPFPTALSSGWLGAASGTLQVVGAIVLSRLLTGLTPGPSHNMTAAAYLGFAPAFGKASGVLLRRLCQDRSHCGTSCFSLGPFPVLTTGNKRSRGAGPQVQVVNYPMMCQRDWGVFEHDMMVSEDGSSESPPLLGSH
ncbi:hypothetical protein F5144DRAFT_29322 [Chaetomium tenue]|uniref:Uncharacterized protein n=1 Tax=Chaetomium tenue TaxID=1854479 RepID=A0ACB7PM83_9PEZI|nr:hypothetical protein F5144DRAFT_29322 [Chaetomium globosum]